MKAEGYRFEEVVTIRRIIAVSAFLMTFALAALGISTAHGATPASWGSDLNAGIRDAKQHGQPLLVLIASEGCPHCAAQELELKKASVSKALRNVVKVRAEASDNAKFAARHAAEGTPTMVLFSPDTGYIEPVYTNTGVMSSSQLVRLGKSLDKPAKSMEKVVASSR